MFYEINKKFTAILLVLFLINISIVFAETENDDSSIFKKFNAYMLYGYHELSMFFTPDADISVMDDWSTDTEVIPKFDQEKGKVSAVRISRNGEVISEDDASNLVTLFSKKMLYEHLEKNQVTNVKETKIIYASGFIKGYIVLIKTEDEIYFMTVMIDGTKYGVFEHERVYSLNEFKKLCEPQPCTLTIFNELIDCDQPPIMEFGITFLPLRACFEYFGFTVEWDQETKTATCYNDNDTYTYVADNTLNRYQYVYKNGEQIMYSAGFRMVGDRILICNLFTLFLWHELGIYIREDRDNHAVIVIHQSCDDDFCKKYRS